ncbi:MAG: peptidyl-prolyl cis-trans isomerase C [Candidatus Omnitrophota bacterium]|jgi:peptidyl-prolyl cis-trans isomerase C
MLFGMFRRTCIYILIILIASTTLTGCLEKKSESPALATFDGGKITEEDFRETLENLPETIRGAALKQKQEFLESFVTEKLLLQEAEIRGLQHMKDVDHLIRQARDRILVAKLVEETVDDKVKVALSEVQSYYDNHQTDFVTPFRLRASHILVSSREQADKIHEMLELGEPFERAAEEYSLDPTAIKGGDIGYFQRGQLIPEVEEAAFGLRADEFSPVIESSFGFHIVKVTGEAKPQTKSFDSVKDIIEERLILEKKSQYFDELVVSLQKKLDVQINTAALNEFEYVIPEPDLNTNSKVEK